MSPQKIVTVLNTPCILTTKERLAEDLASHCRNRKPDEAPLSVDFTNVHIVAMRTTDPGFYDKTSDVDWFVSDSQVLNWGISALGGTDHSRVYGPDFMSYFFQHGEIGLKHFFLGGSQDCLNALCVNLKKIQPGLIVSGAVNGYFKPDDEAAIASQINACDPDIVWVGLGTPKQQEWIHRNKPLLRCGTLLAVGFAFDVNAGTKTDAPAWLGPLGLTWLHRLATEPRRLWRRYLIYNSVYIFRLCFQMISGRNYGPPS